MFLFFNLASYDPPNEIFLVPCPTIHDKKICLSKMLEMVMMVLEMRITTPMMRFSRQC